jgi:hypothetical protein
MGYETENKEVPEDFVPLGENLDSFMEGLSLSEKDSDAKSRVYYPELHFEGENAKVLCKQLSKTGVALVHYKKISETVTSSSRDGKEKTSYRVGIQIHGIKPETDKQLSTKQPKEDPEDLIERGLEAAEADSESETNQETE